MLVEDVSQGGKVIPFEGVEQVIDPLQGEGLVSLVHDHVGIVPMANEEAVDSSLLFQVVTDLLQLSVRLGLESGEEELVLRHNPPLVISTEHVIVGV